MIAHVVLLAPRADLTVERQQAFVAALERAARDIPSVRSVRVGRRVRHGQAYEARMPLDLPFLAIFEFDDLAGLQSYLAHPAHEDLARHFYESLDAALAYDYAMDDVRSVRGWVKERQP